MSAFNHETLRNLTLSDNEVHVWRYRLDRPASELKTYQSLLCSTEKERMGRLRITIARNHFIVARGLLRSILAAYLSRDPSRVEFEYNEYGKPRLAPRPYDKNIHFNLTHSRDIALIAVTCCHDVGIDTEYMRANINHEAIAKRFFSPAENAALKKLNADRRREAFFHCWTCKEAFIKARGDGLRYPLCDFDVSANPDRPAQLLATRPDPGDVLRWTLMKLDAAPSFAAALVVRSQGINVSYRVLT